MTQTVKERGEEFAKFLASLSPEDRDHANEENRKEALEQHKRFTESFKARQCSFCGDQLTDLNEEKPCRHWLLNPDGFRKQHFELLANKISFSALDNYLRWVANEEAFAQNINDLADEGTGKLVELTIKYKNIEWSFSCTAGDLSGHESGNAQSQQPHYHFQMYVDGLPFIRYNDFHIPLTVEDIGFLGFTQANPGRVKKRIVGGAGMSEVLNESTLEHLVSMGRSGLTEDEAAKAPIKLDTVIVAEPGKSIKGEGIFNLIQAAKKEGVTMASKAKDLHGVSVQTIVSPGPGVVSQAPRSGRKKRGNWPAAGSADTELRCHDGTGGGSWRGGSLHASSSLRLCG